MVARNEVWLVRLDPAEGSEIRKTRPAVIVSPDQMNRHLRTVLICPLTSTVKGWPSRVSVTFSERNGEIAADQVRVVDKGRLIKHLGTIAEPAAAKLTSVLVELFR